MCQKMRKMEQHLIRCIADTQTTQLQHTSQTISSHVKDKNNEQIARANLHKTCNTGFCCEISSASLSLNQRLNIMLVISHQNRSLTDSFVDELVAEAWPQGP